MLLFVQNSDKIPNIWTEMKQRNHFTCCLGFGYGKAYTSFAWFILSHLVFIVEQIVSPSENSRWTKHRKQFDLIWYCCLTVETYFEQENSTIRNSTLFSLQERVSLLECWNEWMKATNWILHNPALFVGMLRFNQPFHISLMSIYHVFFQFRLLKRNKTGQATLIESLLS